MQTCNRDPEEVLIDCIEIVYRTMHTYPVGCEVHDVLKELVDLFGEVPTWSITR